MGDDQDRIWNPKDDIPGASVPGDTMDTLGEPVVVPHKHWFHPEGRLFLYTGLFLICCMGFGSYFAYDSPASLQEQIIKAMDITTFDFGMLYSMYSWPNVILCFFGGFLIDKVFGIRAGALLFCLIITIGQATVALGAFTNAYWLMELGRFIFGIGGESLAVAQNIYAVSWFKGKELNFVFGLQLSMSRVGSTVGMNILHPMYETFGKIASGHTLIGIIMLVTCGTCFFSMVCSVLLAGMDKKYEKIKKEKAILDVTTEPAPVDEPFSFREIFKFSTSFYVLSFICVFFYISVFPFVSFGTVFFKRKYNFNDGAAIAVDSVINIISAALCPLFGFLIDVTGRNVMWVFLATFITLMAHSFLAFTLVNPWFPMALMGIGYSILACALWPMVSLIVADNKLGTAYGLMQSIQNLGLAVTPILAGAIVDLDGYVFLEIMFLAYICVTVILVCLLYVTDLNNGSILNESAKDRRIRNEKKTPPAAAMEDPSVNV